MGAPARGGQPAPRDRGITYWYYHGEAGEPALRKLFGWLERGLLLSRHFLPEELAPVREESLRYRRRWVDFADACLVVLSDREPALPLATVDRSGFAVYFRSRHRRARRLYLPSC
jgi:hypothetical protein